MRHSGAAGASRTLLALAAAAGLNVLPGCGDGPMAPPTPTLRVSVSTTGVDVNADGYVLRGGDIEQAIASAPSVTVYRDLAPGSYEIRLEGLDANCAFDGPAVVSVTIVEGQLSSVSFRVQCTATTGAFQVSAPTTGRDFSNASYFVTVAGAGLPTRSTSVRPNQAATLGSLPGGAYQLTFESRADNCEAIGDNPRTASIIVGGPEHPTTDVVFQVECFATTGEVHLVSSTTGEDRDSDGYMVWRDGSQLITTICDPFEFGCYYTFTGPLHLDPDAEWLLREVAPGTQLYELRDVAPNCTVGGVHPRPVTVTVGDTVEVGFNVLCSSLP